MTMPRTGRPRAAIGRGGALLAIATAFVSCATPPGSDGELPDEFEAILRAYEKGWQGRDADALAALFTEDGWVMSNEREPVQGRVAIRERYAKSGGPLALRSLHWERQGDLAIILGAYGREPDGPVSGKFTLTLRRGADGAWLILSDMDNVNRRR